MKLLCDMTEQDYFQQLAKNALPPGPSANFVCSYRYCTGHWSVRIKCTTIRLLRETADRLEKHKDTPR